MVEDKIPQIVFPDKSGQYKVIQFYVDERPYLRFGRKPETEGGDFHEFILERFADELGVKCRKIDRGDGNQVFALPEGEQYKTCGAGKCELNLEQKTARFYDRSIDYRMGINNDYLISIRELCPDWNIS